MIKDREKFAVNLSPFIAVLLGLTFGFILIAMSGYDPIEGYKELFLGGFEGIGKGNFKRIGNTFSKMTPLLFTGASVAFAFRTGLFNIGVAGQFIIGGYFGLLTSVKLDLPPVIFPIVCITVAFIAGGLWASIAGLLKAKFNIHEVVVSIMLNYTAMWVVAYLGRTFTSYEGSTTETQRVSANASLKADWLTDMFNRANISLAFFIGIAVLIIVYIVLEKTTFGYELKAVGFNKNAAKYAGISVNKNIIYSMFISGGIAGMGGVAYYMGYTNHVRLGVMPTYGFDGIAVSLLGLNTPLGVFLSSFLFGFMQNAASTMEARTDIPREIIQIVTASVIYFSAISLVIRQGILKLLPKDKKKEGDK